MRDRDVPAARASRASAAISSGESVTAIMMRRRSWVMRVYTMYHVRISPSADHRHERGDPTATVVYMHMTHTDTDTDLMIHARHQVEVAR